MMVEPAQENEALFYDAVSDLATTVELAIRDIRISPKLPGFRFSDLKGIGKYADFTVVEAVAEAYLAATRADEQVFRGSRSPNDYRRGSAIFENTAVTEGQAGLWLEYYSKTATANFWIKNMARDMDEASVANLAMLAQNGNVPPDELISQIVRRVGSDAADLIHTTLNEVYHVLNIKENQHLLYALAFTAEAEKRGWNSKSGDELAGSLRRKGVPINEFEHYTGRDLSAEQEEKEQAEAQARAQTQATQPTPAPAAQTVQTQRPARTRTARPVTGMDADDISTVIAAVDRGERPAQPRTPEQPRIYTEPYVLRNVRCVGSDGNVFEEYAELHVQADVVRQQNNSHRGFTPYQAIVHFENQGEQFLPSVALSCNVLLAIFRAAVRKEADGTYTTLDEHAKQILDQHKDYGPGYGWHAQNTVVNWKAKGILRRAQNSEIIHYPTKDDFPEHGGTADINMQRRKITKEFDRNGFESCTLEEACQKTNMFAYLQDFTGLQNPRELGEVAEYYGRTPRVWISKENKTRAAWLGCNGIYDYFILVAYDRLNGTVAARGVAS